MSTKNNNETGANVDWFLEKIKAVITDEELDASTYTRNYWYKKILNHTGSLRYHLTHGSDVEVVERCVNIAALSLVLACKTKKK